MSTPTAVLVLYNAPRTDAHTPGHEADAGVLAEVNAVVDALQRAGHRARPVAVSTLREAGTTLHTAPETAVFNLVESLRPDEADAALVPAVAAALGKTCSGAGTRCQTLAFDKWQARACLSAHGVCVPAAVLAPPGGVPLPTDLPPGPLQRRRIGGGQVQIAAPQQNRVVRGGAVQGFPGGHVRSGPVGFVPAMPHDPLSHRPFGRRLPNACQQFL